LKEKIKYWKSIIEEIEQTISSSYFKPNFDPGIAQIYIPVPIVLIRKLNLNEGSCEYLFLSIMWSMKRDIITKLNHRLTPRLTIKLDYKKIPWPQEAINVSYLLPGDRTYMRIPLEDIPIHYETKKLIEEGNTAEIITIKLEKLLTYFLKQKVSVMRRIKTVQEANIRSLEFLNPYIIINTIVRTTNAS